LGYFLLTPIQRTVLILSYC